MRLGRGPDSLALLVPSDPHQDPSPDLRLAHVSVRNHAECIVRDGDDEERGNFGIVECLTKDPDVLRTFLELIGWMMPSEGLLDLAAARDIFHRVVQLLREPTRAARTSELGLWGELFVLSRAEDPATLARAWHATPRERWDFVAGHLRVDVKTSSGSRRHHFSYEQLDVPDTVQMVVASLLTTASPTGPSIAELLREVSNQVPSPLRESMIEVAIRSLGDNWAEGSLARFDPDLAAASLRFFDSTEVPSVDTPPVELSEVRFVADLSDVEFLGWGMSHLEQALAVELASSKSASE